MGKMLSSFQGGMLEGFDWSFMFHTVVMMRRESKGVKSIVAAFYFVVNKI